MTSSLENNSISRELIIKRAREWLGTPYKHQHSQKGLGCDCLGLLLGVYSSFFGPPFNDIPPYGPGWDEVEKTEQMLHDARTYLIERDGGIFEPGDVLVFRMREDCVAKHCGIVTEVDRMIHGQQDNFVSEVYLVPYWKKRIAGIFKFPGI